MKANVKENIIQVAQEMFSRYGFRKTTMDEIAYAARKGKSSLYYYFSSKEDVFQAVVEKEADHLFGEIMLSTKYAENAKEKIGIYIYKRLNGFKNWGNLFEAIKDEYLANMQFIEKIRKKYDEKEIAMMAAYIKEGISNGEFKPMDANLTAKIIVVAMKGLEIPLLMEKNSDRDFKKEIDEMLDILYYGMST